METCLKLSCYALKEIIQRHQISVANGDVKYLDGGWYVTHSGLLRLASRRHCAGIHSRPVLESSDPTASRWVFRAAVFKSRACKGFVAYGDADPSNVSPLVHGAEMRVAETRAVNRALRKAYGIGICSVEELGSSAESRQFPPNRRSFLYNLPTGTAGAPRSATVCVSSSASTNSMPLSSSPTPSISAAPKPSAKPLESR